MLTEDRNTRARNGEFIGAGLKAATILYAGAMIAITVGGLLVPASADPTLTVLGRSPSRFDNSAGADSAITASIERGIFNWDNSANADAITLANVDQLCYAVDDHTVALTDGGGTRPVAGRIFDVDAGGVWVDHRVGATGVKVCLPLQCVDLLAADALVYRIVAPISGRVTKIYSVLEGHAIAGADATLTGKVGANAITGGVITHPLAASAIGEVKSAVPTAANGCNAGDVISFTIGGGNTNNAATARLVVEITP